MKRLANSRDLLMLGLVLGALIAASSILAYRRAEEIEGRNSFRAYSTHSSYSQGALALKVWLEVTGYRTRQLENQAFEVDDTVNVLFVLNPSERIDDGQARQILRWVERGNTLILAEQGFGRRSDLLTALGLRVEPFDAEIREARLAQPLVDASVGSISVDARFGLVPVAQPARVQVDGVGYVPILVADGKPVLARLSHGGGTIWVASVPELFTNENLRDPDNGILIASLLARVPRGSMIGFDEHHLGFQGGSSWLALVYTTPWGWGILFSIAVALLYLALNGRRFGRVVPLPREIARRRPSEYVVSMAQLYRRANKRGMVLRHYRYALKRRLGRPFHLNPEIPDEHFVDLMGRLRPDIDAPALRKALAQLRRADTAIAGEAEFVKSVHDAITLDAPKRQ
jgi:hypothetical protein